MKREPSEPYSYQDYLQWEGRWELIDGVAYNMSPSPTWEHQFAIVELSFILRSYFQNKNCYVAIAPFDVRFSNDGDYERAPHVVQPDISVICHKHQLTNNGCLGAPTLVIEVLSPSTALKDRNEKFKLYEKFGVQEYWIVDPVYQTIEVFGFEDGFFKKREVFGKDQQLTSFVFPDLTVEVSSIFFPTE
ncbi:Uma2 family endonuclease [Geobacillus sp. E263]|uniref:Uma2 family endonuclease n=1 Tax=Geobacillus sp. E263 TaxID=391290 RepID=UPI001179AAE6|nr:Uma2 family endonuclease [Geobacillus sp. E263]